MIITISREFGSGGRELGKRLSDAFAIPCYDNEIIKYIAREKGFDENFVSHMSEKSISPFYISTIGHRITSPINYASLQKLEIAAAECRIIENFASSGSCVIIGRSADVILKDRNPFSIFVYASKSAKIERCIKRARAEESLSASDLEKRMKEIDRARAGHRAALTDSAWGDKANYNLCINTTGIEIKSIIKPLSDYIRTYFGGKV